MGAPERSGGFRVQRAWKTVAQRSVYHRLTIFAIHFTLKLSPASRLSAMPMNISLTPHLEKMIREKISSGSYNSASEVVREALRLLEQEDELRVLKLQKLRQDIKEGLESGPSQVFDAQQFKRAARERKKAATRAK
jgi:antitoxin ParD1/3/4